MMDCLLCFTAPERHHAHATVCFPSVIYFNSVLTWTSIYNKSESDNLRHVQQLEMSPFFHIACTFELRRCCPVGNM